MFFFKFGHFLYFLVATFNRNSQTLKEFSLPVFVKFKKSIFWKFYRKKSKFYKEYTYSMLQNILQGHTHTPWFNSIPQGLICTPCFNNIQQEHTHTPCFINNYIFQFPRTRDGHEFLWTVIDYITHYMLKIVF